MPQLILLDLKLPKMDALELLRRVRSEPRTKLPPVVILTSSNEEQARIMGANNYIRKLMGFSQIIGAVRQLALCWLLLNEPAPVGTGS